MKTRDQSINGIRKDIDSGDKTLSGLPHRIYKRPQILSAEDLEAAAGTCDGDGAVGGPGKTYPSQDCFTANS